jgi:hypothetical protein
MGLICIQCPQTGQQVFTGVEVDRARFNQVDTSNNRASVSGERCFARVMPAATICWPGGWDVGLCLASPTRCQVTAAISVNQTARFML